MKQHGKPTRFIKLIDDIYNHVFQWATDEDWGKLPPRVNVAMTALMNELRVSKAIEETCTTVSDGVGKTDSAEMRDFIVFFKKKYLEYTDMQFDDVISLINKVNIARVIKTVKEHGGEYINFLEWFFDEYCALEENKKFMPPTINYMCSDHIVKKYLFLMKDALRMKKTSITKENTKMMLFEIALPMQKRICQNDFGQKIIDFNRGNMSSTKFLSIMKAFAVKFKDAEGIAACEKLIAKIEDEAKKAPEQA